MLWTPIPCRTENSERSYNTGHVQQWSTVERTNAWNRYTSITEGMPTLAWACRLSREPKHQRAEFHASKSMQSLSCKILHTFPKIIIYWPIRKSTFTVATWMEAASLTTGLTLILSSGKVSSKRWLFTDSFTAAFDFRSVICDVSRFLNRKRCWLIRIWEKQCWTYLFFLIPALFSLLLSCLAPLLFLFLLCVSCNIRIVSKQLIVSSCCFIALYGCMYLATLRGKVGSEFRADS